MPVAVYFRQDDVVVHALRLSDQGVSIAGLPAVLIPRSAGAAELGRAAKGILLQSRDTVAHPTNWTNVGRPVLDAIDVASWNALHRSSRLCNVHESGGTLVLTPTHNGGTAGPERGYHDISDKAATVAIDVDAEELGNALLKAERSCS